MIIKMFKNSGEQWMNKIKLRVRKYKEPNRDENYNN